MKRWTRVIFIITVLVLMTGLILAGCTAPVDQKDTTGAEAEQSEEVNAGDQEAEETIKIVYVANMLSHEFYQRCIVGMEQAAAENGIELLIADSNSDVNMQVNHLETYMNQDISAIVMSPIDPAALVGAVQKAADNGIPTITESNSVDGAATMVGAYWKKNGENMGEWTGQYLLDNNLEGNVLIIGFPNFEDTVNVEAGFTEKLNESGATINKVVSVDGQAFKEKAMQVATDALTANPDINVIMGINDDSILGAVQAAKALGMDLSKIVTLTHGLEGNPGCVAMLEEKTLTAGYALFPELYGQSMINAALAAIAGEELPELYESPMTMVTAENGGEFYIKDGDEYVLNFDAIKDLNN